MIVSVQLPRRVYGLVKYERTLIQRRQPSVNLFNHSLPLRPVIPYSRQKSGTQSLGFRRSVLESDIMVKGFCS